MKKGKGKKKEKKEAFAHSLIPLFWEQQDHIIVFT